MLILILMLMPTPALILMLRRKAFVGTCILYIFEDEPIVNVSWSDQSEVGQTDVV